MGRLIDTDDVYETIEMIKDPTVATDVLDHILATTPTAYDIDMVIMELMSLWGMMPKRIWERMMGIVYGGFRDENH